MDQLTKAQRREAAERLTAILDMIAEARIEATAIEAAFITGAEHGLRGNLRTRPTSDCT